jgi:hypothetical protein
VLVRIRLEEEAEQGVLEQLRVEILLDQVVTEFQIVSQVQQLIMERVVEEELKKPMVILLQPLGPEVRVEVELELLVGMGVGIQ